MASPQTPFTRTGEASAFRADTIAQDYNLLQDTAATYANQIPVLALRNAELAADNRRLAAALSDRSGTVTALSAQDGSAAASSAVRGQDGVNAGRSR